MYRRWIQRALAELTAAVMLLSTGFSPAIKHSHAGGDQPHHQHLHLDSTARSSPLPEAADPAVALAVSSAQRETPHLHIAWFGLEFTFTERCPGSDACGEDPVPRDGLVQHLEQDQSLTSNETAIASPVVVFLLHQPSPIAAHAIVSAPSLKAAPVNAPPLCDRARHERSGVQLI